MKHLLLTSMLLLSAVAAFAQNSAVVAQNGTANSASALQGGSSLTATISQVGSTPTTVTNNTAITDQTGTGHSATINQNGTAPNGSTFNRAYATQRNGTTGANSVTISQSNGSGGAAARGGDRSVVAGDLGNFSGTFQEGNANRAAVIQDGPNSKANIGEITQKGDNNTATTTQNGTQSGVALVYQGFDPNVPVVNIAVTSNTATIDQSGSTANQAFIRQFSDGNTAFVRQIGANSTTNLTRIDQGPGGGGNTATVRQGQGFQTVTSNTALIGQYGTNGFATIDHDRFAQSTSNVASITQTTGSVSNTATIMQSSNANAQFNVATIQQAGSNGLASISESDGTRYNQSSIQQGTGSSGDKAYIRHAFSFTSTASISQNLTATTGGSSNNVASIVQGRDTGGGVSGTSMTAVISQEGKDNSALLNQVGTGHKATITQTGNNNVVTGPLSAASIDVLLTDIALGNYAEQGGTGQVLTVNQTSLDGASLLGNSVSVSQLGTSNTGTVNQTIGAGAMGNNVGMLTQNGIGNSGTITQFNGAIVP